MTCSLEGSKELLTLPLRVSITNKILLIPLNLQLQCRVVCYSDFRYVKTTVRKSVPSKLYMFKALIGAIMEIYKKKKSYSKSKFLSHTQILLNLRQVYESEWT